MQSESFGGRFDDEPAPNPHERGPENAPEGKLKESYRDILAGKLNLLRKKGRKEEAKGYLQGVKDFDAKNYGEEKLKHQQEISHKVPLNSETVNKLVERSKKDQESADYKRKIRFGK
ncbi:MAG TPA: hypothetical protein VJH63_03875 [Candidatus Paceibacterota bacterium]